MVGQTPLAFVQPIGTLVQEMVPLAQDLRMAVTDMSIAEKGCSHLHILFEHTNLEHYHLSPTFCATTHNLPVRKIDPRWW